jgi:predicted small lipoprotein YifL
MRVVSMSVLLVTLTGCGRSQPVAAGGRPVEHWLESIRSSDAKLRKQAATKLGHIGPENADVVTALVAALKDPDTDVRCAAILALVQCGSAGHVALPDLAELQRRDPQPRVRDHATRAIAAMERQG